MTKTAALALRINPELKARLERLAKEEGRSLASLVERRLELPKWILKDPQPHNWKKRGPLVSLRIAEGMPTAMMSASSAEVLGKQLIEVAGMAKRMTPTDG